MGSRIVLPGSIFICSPCPHGCKESLTLKIAQGENVRNGECPHCKGKVHVHHYDSVVKAGHSECACKRSFGQ